MLAKLRPLLLRWLRVPPEPEPPFGAPGSIQVFRAGRNFYYVRLARWVLTQLGAVAGLVASVLFIAHLRGEFEEMRNAPPPPTPPPAAAANPAPAPAPTAPTAATASAEPATEPAAKPKRKSSRKQGGERVRNWLRESAPDWTMDAVALFELLAIAGFLVQLPLSFAAVRLDWEYRWYIVTDRSLRIRAGLLSLQEATMSFANIQQVEIMQGPLQRLLGIADVRVQSAGGGGGGQHQGHEQHDSMHTGVFHGVDNAQEIRDLILDRLRHFRETGLGDPDEHHAAAPESAAAAPAPADTLAAAQELLAEARALRRTLG